MNSHDDPRESLNMTAARIISAGILPAKTYLVGGTAVFFYLNHRLSYELDFYTSERFRSEFILHQLRQTFRSVQIELMENDTVLAYVGAAKVKFSLFHFPYSVLAPSVPYPFQDGTVCPLASMADLISKKCIAIAQRGSAKDFVDLFFLLREERMDFAEVLALIQMKYTVQDSFAYQLKTSLVYFEDAEKEIGDIDLIMGSGLEKMSRTFWDRVKWFFLEFIR